jgi:hypothetical protein
VFDLVRGGFILCPQRDSNPRCRLESAKLGISRCLPRSFVIDRNLLALGHTVQQKSLIACTDFHLSVGSCVPQAPSIRGLMRGTTQLAD